MKKIFATLFAVMFLFAGNAMADCYGNSCEGTGLFGAFDTASNSQGDIDLTFGVNSVAFGVNRGTGSTTAQANGSIYNGEGSVSAMAAGGSQGNTWTTAGTDFASSQSFNFAGTEGKVSVAVDPDGQAYGGWYGWYGWYGYYVTVPAYGDTAGSFNGSASQGSLNATAVVGGNGFTGGIAGQRSSGDIHGYVQAYAGPDFHDYYYYYGWNYDSYAAATAQAGILMTGGSFSVSQHVAGPGYDGLRTDVNAFTNIDSYGYSNAGYTGWWWNDYAYGYTYGGWNVIGGAATMTVTPNAKAVAYGIYTGHGSLNCDYTGNATGFSQVETFTSPNLNGSYVKSSSGMSVTSKVTNSYNNNN